MSASIKQCAYVCVAADTLDEKSKDDVAFDWYKTSSDFVVVHVFRMFVSRGHVEVLGVVIVES